MVVICIDLPLKWYLPNCFFLIYCVYIIDYNNRQFLDFANLQDSCCFLASGRHVAHRGQCEARRCRQHWRFDARVRRPRPFQPCGTVGAVGCAAHAGQKGHWKVKSWESRSGFGITIWFCDIRNILVKWQYRFIGQSLRKPRGLGRAHEFVTFAVSLYIYMCMIVHAYTHANALHRVRQGPQVILKSRCCSLRSWALRHSDPWVVEQWWCIKTQDTLWWTNKKLWKITIFNGKIHYKWPFSIAMLVHQRVYIICVYIIVHTKIFCGSLRLSI